MALFDKQKDEVLKTDTKAFSGSSNGTVLNSAVISPTRKKLSVEKIDLANQDAGYSFTGKYIGTSESEPFSKVNEKGEIITKSLTFAIFERDDNHRFKVIRDAGLNQALSDAMIKEGQKIEVVKLAKTKIKGGARTMNQYDVFGLEA